MATDKKPKRAQADIHRCQAEVPRAGFPFDGSPELIRCINAPIFLLDVNQPGTEEAGQMSVCAACFRDFVVKVGKGRVPGSARVEAIQAGATPAEPADPATKICLAIGQAQRNIERGVNVQLNAGIKEVLLNSLARIRTE